MLRMLRVPPSHLGRTLRLALDRLLCLLCALCHLSLRLRRCRVSELEP